MDNVCDIQSEKSVKYLKCVVESCPGRAKVKNGVIHTNGEHVQHDGEKEEIDRLKMSSECRKRAAEDDSHTLRQIFDEVLYVTCHTRLCQSH